MWWSKKMLSNVCRFILHSNPTAELPMKTSVAVAVSSRKANLLRVCILNIAAMIT